VEKYRLLHIFTQMAMDGEEFTMPEAAVNRTCVPVIEVEQTVGITF